VTVLVLVAAALRIRVKGRPDLVFKSSSVPTILVPRLTNAAGSLISLWRRLHLPMNLFLPDVSTCERYNVLNIDLLSSL
jgi:hypothetical protein